MMSGIIYAIVHRAYGPLVAGSTLPRGISKKYFDFFFHYFH